MEEKKKRKWLFAAAAAALLCILLFIPTAIRLFEAREEAARQLAARQELEASLRSGSSTASGLIELDGKMYRRNSAVRAILCIGVDSQGEMEQHTASGQGGQADGIFLVAQDMMWDQVKILMIPRDTMTEITYFDLMGNELGKDSGHLTLAYAYGDGREKSCELLSEAVSNLLFGLQLDGYMAMNISSIALLNDEIGGVPVIIKEDGMEERDPEFVKGEEVLLEGAQAELFLRYRDTTKPQTALSRMSRQKQYMQSYLATVKSEAAKDDTLITRLVNVVENHMITDMAKDQYMDMGLAVLNSQQTLGESDFLTVPGQAVETAYFDEYHPDQDGLKRIIVELFYKEV